MTKSALPGRRMNQEKQMCAEGVQGSSIIETTVTPMLLSFSSLISFFTLKHLFILVVIFGPVFQWVGFISRFLEEDQSFADKEKLARYGLYHFGRLPLLLLSISIVNDLIEYYPVLMGPRHIVIYSTNYRNISLLYASVLVLVRMLCFFAKSSWLCLSTITVLMCH